MRKGSPVAEMAMQHEDLPRLLADIAGVAGRAAALRLAGEFGGAELYIPRRMEPDHPVVRAVGGEAADWLSEWYGGGYVLVPLGPATTYRRQRGRIRELIAAGLPNSQIARRLKCHVRTVQRERSGHR